MKPIPASQVLTEFGAAAPKPSTNAADPFRVHVDPSEKARKPPPPDKPSVLEETFARGYEEGRAVALKEMDAKLEEQKHFFETQHELERSMWVSREADKVGEQLDEGLQAIKNEISERTARILKSFLTEQIHRQAMDALWEALELLLSRDRGVTLEISGREDFLQLLRERLSERKTAAVFTPNESVEVRVRVGQTVLETQLAAWLARLEELAKDRRRRGAPV